MSINNNENFSKFGRIMNLVEMVRRAVKRKQNMDNFKETRKIILERDTRVPLKPEEMKDEVL